MITLNQGDKREYRARFHPNRYYPDAMVEIRIMNLCGYQNKY